MAKIEHVEHRSGEKLVWSDGFVWVCRCGNLPCDGLDCGLFAKGHEPRRKLKPLNNVSLVRKRAWETRRAKYGQQGHNGSYRR